MKKPAYIHPTTVVEEGAKIGDGTKVWLFNHLMHDCQIGEDCQIGQNVYVGKAVKIGNGVKIQNNVSVYESVEIEDDVFCGPSMVFTNVNNPRSFISRKHEFKTTKVKKGATIGANATIVCGVTLGEYCFIAAGTTITKDVPAYALMIGVPGVQKGWMCRCAEKLTLSEGQARCEACGSEYQLDGEGCLIKLP